jgi:uncharacterized protein involved in outer membrane biogenesis
MTDTVTPPAARRLARGRLRWPARALAALVLLAILSWLAVPAAVRRIGQAQGTEALGRALRIGDAHFNPLTLELRLDDVALAGAQAGEPDTATLAHLVLNFEWRSLWQRAPVLNAVRLEAPRIRIARTSAGHFDVDDILARLARRPAAPADAPPARFAVYNIQVEGGSIAFDDRVVHDRHQVDELALGVPFVSNLPGDTDVKVQPRLRFVLDGARYDSLAQATPFRTERSGNVELHTGAVALGPWLPYWPAALGWRPTQGALKIDASLAFDAPPRGAPRVVLAGEAALDDLAVVDAAGEPLVAWRRLALHVDELRPFEQKLALRQVALAGLELPLARDARGSLNLLRALAGGAPASAAAPAAPASAPATPWTVRVAAIDVDDAHVAWRDGAVSPPAQYDVRQLRAHVADLRWPLPAGPAAAASAPASAPVQVAAAAPGEAVRVHVEGRWLAGVPPAAAAAASAPADGGFVVDGRLGARRSEVDVALERIALAPLRPYVAPYWTPATEGLLSTRVRLDFDGAPGAVPPVIEVAELGVDGLRLHEPGRAAAALAWQRATISGLSVDLARRRVALASAALSQPELWLERDAAGMLNAARWMPAAASASAPASAPAGAAWQARVGSVAIAGGRVHWRDTPAAGPVALDVDALQLAVGGVGWPAAAGERSSVRLAARLTPGNRSGTVSAGLLDFDGRVGLAPVSWDGRLRAERIPVHAVDAYLADASPLQLLHADAGWRGSVQGELTAAGPRLHAKGDALLTDLHARARRVPDPANAPADDLLAWQSLGARGTELTLAPGKPPVAVVEGVTLAGAFARLVVTEQGHFNLTDLAPAPAAAASAPAPVAVAATAPSAADAAPDIRIGGIAWTDARIEYSDRFVRPNYSAELSDVQGTLGAFSARAPELAALQLKGRVAGTGVLDVQGRLNPLARPLALEVRARAADIELAPLSPYAAKYAGYAIERGKLTMDLRYSVAPDGRLEAANQVVLNQLTFGERVDSPSATKLPVLFAVALLKDRNGVIDVNLPIGGSINDPDFSVGGIVVKIVVNLLTKALTAPFALLAGGGHEDLSQALFVPGTARPADGAEATFDKVAHALQDRPALQLTITGLADADQEHAALQAAALDARLVGLRRSELLQAGEADPPAAPEVSAADRTRLVKRLYQDTKLADKPRNLVGLAKDVPQAEMEQRLATGLPLAADAARELAVRRAIVVRDALAARGLSNERMFVASPKVHGAGSAEPGAWQPHAQLELSAR